MMASQKSGKAIQLAAEHIVILTMETYVLLRTSSLNRSKRDVSIVSPWSKMDKTACASPYPQSYDNAHKSVTRYAVSQKGRLQSAHVKI